MHPRPFVLRRLSDGLACVSRKVAALVGTGRGEWGVPKGFLAGRVELVNGRDIVVANGG